MSFTNYLKEREESFDEKFGIYTNYADFCPDGNEYKDFNRHSLLLFIQFLKGEMGDAEQETRENEGRIEQNAYRVGINEERNRIASLLSSYEEELQNGSTTGIEQVKSIPDSTECIRCGLLKSTCEAENGNEWVKNCCKVEGQKHDFGEVDNLVDN